MKNTKNIWEQALEEIASDRFTKKLKGGMSGTLRKDVMQSLLIVAGYLEESNLDPQFEKEIGKAWDTFVGLLTELSMGDDDASGGGIH